MGHPDDAAPAKPQAVRAPTRRYQAKRDAIVRFAVEEMNRKGVRGMTLGEVAARLDLVPTGVIYYFKNKEELAAAAFLKGIGQFEALIASGEGEGAPAERLSAFVGAYFDYAARLARDEADRIPVFNDVRALNSAPVNAAYVDMFRRLRGLLGELPRPHRNARAHLLLSQMFWIPAWLRQAEVSDYPRTAQRMSDILVDGLIAPGAAWPESRAAALSLEGEPASSSELFLKAATQLINDEGYHGASVERISARLNVSKGAFYHHNATKDDLVVACFERTFDLMWRAIRAAEAQAGSGLEVLVGVASALIEHQMAGGGPLLRTSALTTVPEAIRAGLMEKFGQLSYRFASMICDGVADGSLRPVDVNIAAQMLTAAINAAAELHFWTPGVTPQAATGCYVRPVFEGLVSPAGR